MGDYFTLDWEKVSFLMRQPAWIFDVRISSFKRKFPNFKSKCMEIRGWILILSGIERRFISSYKLLSLE